MREKTENPNVLCILSTALEWCWGSWAWIARSKSPGPIVKNSFPVFVRQNENRSCSDPFGHPIGRIMQLNMNYRAFGNNPAGTFGKYFSLHAGSPGSQYAIYPGPPLRSRFKRKFLGYFKVAKTWCSTSALSGMISTASTYTSFLNLSLNS